MHRRISAILAAALAVLLLAGCADSGGSSAPVSAGSETDSGAIAYVPLDDRPDNVERVEYLAESLGYQLDMPQADRYRTCLDGQPLNANGTQFGDRAGLYEWVLTEEAAGCDRYILSLDQLLSGGLVNSRAMAESQPVTLADGSSLTEARLLEQLLDTLAADPHNQVWLLDSVMRLAPTVGYQSFGLNEYNALRAYGMEPRPALSGDELTVENIVSDYALSPGGELIAAHADQPLPENAVKNYLAARERKLRLSDETERLLAQSKYENFRLLIGIDDSSAEDSIQKNEIALLRRGLRSGDDGKPVDWLLSGVDDLGFKAVTKLYLEDSARAGSGGTLAQRGLDAIHIDYFGGTEKSPACEYDYLPLTEIVSEHLTFFGLRETEQQTGTPLQLVVLTQPADAAKKAEYCQAAADRINSNEADGLFTILIDASNGAYSTQFHDLLVKDCHLGALLSYSGFLDMAIVTGTALSHGVARYAWLSDGHGDDAAANRAFQKTLTESIVLDFAYKNTVRSDVIACARDTLGGSPDNFFRPAIDLDTVTGVLSDGMDKAAAPILKNLSRSNLVTSPKDYTGGTEGTAGWGPISFSDWSFPWYRSFEVRMKINVNDLTKPHQKLFSWL